MLSSGQFESLAGQLRTSGGFTVDPRTGNQPTSGVAVAMQGAEETVPRASGADIASYAGRHAKALSQPGAHIGGWDAGDGGGNTSEKELIDQTTARYNPMTRDDPRAELHRNVDVLDASRVIEEHPRGHHMAEVYHAMHVNRQAAAFDLSSFKTIVNPRAPYDWRAKNNTFSEPDEHGSQMRLVRRNH
jgi:hypothetical protein